MLLNKLLYQLLVITIVVGLYTFGVTGQVQAGDSVETDPILDKLEPIGGREGDTLTIVGKNFGNNTSNITITLMKKENKNRFVNILDDLQPSYVYPPNATEHQKLEFVIPIDKGIECNLTGRNFLYNKGKLLVKVNVQKSNELELRFVRINWRRWAALIALIPVVILLLPLFVMAVKVKNRDFLKTLFMDKKTNTYSLSKCQAFAWTIVLIYSYFYLAIGTGLILGKGTIPDFNSSLLGMMGISYGGLLIARGSSARIPKNDLKETPLRLSDLFSEGGEISLPRLQLVGFTITAIIIYLYYLTSANLFVNGLPDIPSTLLGLLGISQGGYIGGKVAGGRLAVNYAVPRRAQLGRENVKLTIIGSGFIANTKVLFGDHPQLIDTKFLNSNSLSVDLPKLSQLGWKQLMIVPPTGSSIVIEEVIEVVDAKIEKVERVQNKPRQVQLTLKDFDLKKIRATIANKPAEMSIDEDNNLLTVTAEADHQD